MLFFLLLAVASAVSVPPKATEPVVMEPSPLEIKELPKAMMEIVVMQPKDAEGETIIMDNICPLGTPFWGSCEAHSDCPRGFMCRGNERTNTKVCCLKNEEMAALTKCPLGESLAKNDFCTADDECGANARCNKDFVMPKETIEEIDEDAKEAGKPLVELGVCCTSDAEWPVALKTCPKGFKLARMAPCGLGIPAECSLGSQCMNPKGWFGRCCSDEATDIKTEPSAYYGRRFGHYGGYRRFGYGGYGGYRRFGYGGYGGYPYSYGVWG